MMRVAARPLIDDVGKVSICEQSRCQTSRAASQMNSRVLLWLLAKTNVASIANGGRIVESVSGHCNLARINVLGHFSTASL